jgi:hypothetical protein
LANAAAIETMLDAFDGLPDIALVPMPVEGFGHKAELDDEVAGQVLRPELVPLFLPEAEQGGFVGNRELGSTFMLTSTFLWSSLYS